VNTIKIVSAACALPLLLAGSVVAAQGAQDQDPSQAAQGQSQQNQQNKAEQNRAQRGQQQGTMGQQGQQQGQQAQQGQQQGQQGQPGQQEITFESLDKNGDGELSRNEVRSGVSSFEDNWDYNRDGEVSTIELDRGLYQAFDANGDEQIEANEFAEAKAKWLPDRYSAEFTQWDLDGDGELSFFEFAEGAQTSRFAGSFDKNNDAKVSTRELSNGVIASIDRNGDGRIERDEWPMS
jgi:Ca2+-binding EF-hand superfamily protein